MSRSIARALLVAGGAIVGCGAPTRSGPPAASSPSTTAPADPPPVHRFSNNWGSGLGCVPRGAELTLTGTLVVRPFGKGTDGAVVQTDADTWVVSYRAEGPLLALRGKRVVARGRECDKQGARITRRHFDLATLAEVAP